ncbi:MAG: endonuclease domain-containing protein [Betaproteobacteria bacterium]
MSIVAEPFLHTHSTFRTRSSRQLRMAAERLLWTYLREGRFPGGRFRRQYLIDTWLADFACPEAKLVIEIESDLTPALALHALSRRSFLESKGFRVLRFSDRDVLIDTRAVLGAIRGALAAKSS